MYLETLSIQGFGCLKTSVVFAPDKLNLVVADNETGKSTLVAAILAAFYGLADDKLSDIDKRPQRKKMTPWVNPEDFGLTLDFIANNRRWRIERDFNSNLVHLSDRDTNRDYTGEYRKPHGGYEIGEDLLGLSCVNFLKSFYLRQEEILDIRDAGGLTPHVQRVATAREGQATSEHAIERLREALRRYTAPGLPHAMNVETAIRQLEKEQQSLKEKLEELDRSRKNIEIYATKLSEIDRKMEELQAARERLELMSILAEVKELERVVERQEALRQEYSRLKEEASRLENQRELSVEDQDRMMRDASHVEGLSGSITKLKQRLEVEVTSKLRRLEADRHRAGTLSDVEENDIKSLEAAIERVSDRRDRLDAADEQVRMLEDRLKQRNVRLEPLNKLRNKFGQLEAEKRRFLEEFRAVYAEAESALREAVSKLDWKRREREMIDERLKRVKSTHNLFLMIGLAGFVFGLALRLIFNELPAGTFIAGTGAVIIGIFAVMRFVGSNPDAVQTSKPETEINDAEQEEQKAQIQLGELAKRLNEIAARMGFNSGNELFNAYIDYIRAQEVLEPLAQAERILAQAHHDHQEASLNLRPFFERVGEEYPAAAVSEAADALRNRYQQAFHVEGEYKALNHRRQELEAEVKAYERERETLLGSINTILRTAGLSESLSVKDAVDAFRLAREKLQRRQALTTEILPRMKADIIPDEDVRAKRDRANMLKSQLEMLKSNVKGELQVENSREFYRDQADKLSLEVETLVKERANIQSSIAASYSHFQSHYPTLLQRLENLENEIQQALSYQKEIDIALQTMNEISREVYRSWAQALSEEAAPILQSLNPRYRDLSFNEDLRFTIYDRDNDRLLSSDEIDMALSSGARDEVFLAARLGIAAYLSRGAKGALPVVLDEPLITADDAKFLSGMEFFMEKLSRDHQVLIMSCHEKRHRWLAEKKSTLYEQRVHEIQLT